MKKIIAVSIIALVALALVPQFAHAQTEDKSAKQYINLRAEVWNEFFRMTTAAFTVGAVVSGTMIWLVWRFRESHPKNKTPTRWEKLDDPTTGTYEKEGH
ncbi:MAG TPA: heme transporter CcmC [Candidatus Nitrosotalea sp.]|jgi:heme/copper-type cytochrome/quinol oxidase subunit 2|nr:heme transporter CcmC [Candidatus Nitrosotalea sp.]